MFTAGRTIPAPCQPGAARFENRARLAKAKADPTTGRRPSTASLDTTTLGRTATVVRYRRDVRDLRDLDAECVQRAHCGFTTRARALDADFEVLDAALERDPARRLGGDLGGERSRLA